MGRSVFIAGNSSATEAAERRRDSDYGEDVICECVDVLLYIPHEREERDALLRQLIDAVLDEDKGDLTLRKQLVVIDAASTWRKAKR